MKNAHSAPSIVGVSNFAARVYHAVRDIPRGRVSTYSHIAAAIGCPCPRAIGGALRTNPFAPQVPCHRVIASDLRVGGFQGQRTGAALRRKVKLLAEEGVVFDNGRLADPERLWPMSVQRNGGGHRGRSPLSNVERNSL